jgi:hypothetical protein
MATHVPTSEPFESWDSLMRNKIEVLLSSERTSQKLGRVRRAARTRVTAFDSRGSTLLLATLACVGILLLRLQASSARGCLWAEFIILITAAGCMYAWGRSRSAKGSVECSSARDRSPHWILGIALITGPWFCSLIQRYWLGTDGEPNELIWLAMLQNAAVWQAAIATTSDQEWKSFLMSCFLMLFGITCSDQSGMIWIVVPFGVMAAWWLMSRYWQSIERGFVAVDSVPLFRMRIGLLLVLSLVTFAVGGIAWLNRSSIASIDGFMPTSGGRRDADPASRQGIGDGDMLIAAKEEAFSFGPVDSELFLDSKVPSLYDLSSDLYGEPTPLKLKNFRAIALENQVTEAKQEGSESKKKGKEFSAHRQPKNRTASAQPKSTDSKAVLYLIGRTPQHLRLESYDHFDGAEWTHTEGVDAAKTQQAPRLSRIAGKPWMDVQQFSESLIHPVRERLTIKLINLKSDRLISPAWLTHLHIDKMDQVDFFGWTADGQFSMPSRDHVPLLTVTHQLYCIPQLHPLRDSSNPRSQIAQSRDPLQIDDAASRSHPTQKEYLQVPGDRNAWRAIADEMVRSGTGVASSHLTDWQRIEALVQVLRRDIQVDTAHVPDEHCEDVVTHLLSKKAGPDYLIATTAVILGRSLGIPSRLVTGFYASPHRFDFRSGQTEVMPEDLHTWAEVYAAGTWIPIEPSSTFEAPMEYRSWRQWAIQTWWTVRDTILLRPLAVAMAITTLAIVLYLRIRLLDAACSFLFTSTRLLPVSTQIRWNLVLLRWRLWFRSNPRPRSATVREWLDSQLNGYSNLSTEDRKLYINTVQRLAYAPSGTTSNWIAHHSVALRNINRRITQRGLVELFQASTDGLLWNQSHANR